MAITSFGDISPRIGAYAVAKFLSHAAPVQVLAQFGQVTAVPLNKGQTVKFRRATPYSAVTTPLQEGVTPSVSGTTFVDVNVTLLQFGDLHGLTDVIQDTHEDPVLDQMMMLSGEQAAATFEQIIYNVVKGGTAVAYANGAARASVNTAITLNKQRSVVRTLLANKAKKITNILSPSPNIGTVPVEAAFVAIGHTNLGPDIRNMTGFTPVAKYGSMKPICAEEIGSVEDVRYILTPDLAPFTDAGGAINGMLSLGGANADVYPVLFFGQEAFGVTPLKNQRIGSGNNMVVEPTVLNPGVKTKDDPLGQRGYVGWKAWFQCVRLNETWMERLEVAATSL